MLYKSGRPTMQQNSEDFKCLILAFARNVLKFQGFKSHIHGTTTQDIKSSYVSRYKSFKFILVICYSLHCSNRTLYSKTSGNIACLKRTNFFIIPQKEYFINLHIKRNNCTTVAILYFQLLSYTVW